MDCKSTQILKKSICLAAFFIFKRLLRHISTYLNHQAMIRKIFAFILIVLAGFASVWAQTVDGCPSVSPSELGTGNTEVYLDCSNIDNGVTFVAHAVATAVEANDYTVTSIPYAPPYGYTAGTRIFANASDDTWGEVLDLPFAFCYYGNTYNQVVPGANSVATFNTGVAGGSCAWSFSASIPSTSLFANTIFACYRDIYPSTGDYVATTGDGGIFQGVLGEYPCRSYVLSFNNIKLYSCTSIRTFTSMIVLYEGTNIIDIYLRDAPTCTSWNSGNGVIGLQNSNGTMGITPPGRNTGPWTTHEEAWRFIPTGEPDYTVTWYLGTDTTAATGIVVGVGDTITVFPGESTYYTARLQYTACNGDHFDLVNQVHVTVDTLRPELEVTASQDTICPQQEVTITATTEGAVSYEWNTGQNTSSFTLVPENDVTTFVCTITYANNCQSVDSVTVYAAAVIPPPTFTIEPPEICAGDGAIITTDLEYHAYSWAIGETTRSIAVMPSVTTSFSVTVSDELGCTAEGTAQVIVHPHPEVDFIASPDRLMLSDNVAVQFLNQTDTSGFIGGDTYTWHWNFGDGATQVTAEYNTSHLYETWGEFVVTLEMVTSFDCRNSAPHTVYVEPDLEFPNIITPNGDGKNDVFAVRNLNIDVPNRLSVYDRWGKRVFDMQNYKTYIDKEGILQNPESGFTAEHLSDGVYYYVFYYGGQVKSFEVHSSLTVIR